MNTGHWSSPASISVIRSRRCAKTPRATAWWPACARSTAHLFDETRSRAALVHYDYTVLAGTQGHRNHYKQDRIFELASGSACR